MQLDNCCTEEAVAAGTCTFATTVIGTIVKKSAYELAATSPVVWANADDNTELCFCPEIKATKPAAVVVTVPVKKVVTVPIVKLAPAPVRPPLLWVG
jgi:hypothetical protein